MAVSENWVYHRHGNFNAKTMMNDDKPSKCRATSPGTDVHCHTLVPPMMVVDAVLRLFGSWSQPFCAVSIGLKHMAVNVENTPCEITEVIH
jgi:hypothetical protein